MVIRASNYRRRKKVLQRSLKKEGIGLETPVQLAGAVGARLLTDVGENATRQIYWRYNHPMALADKAAEQIIGGKI